ncbi:MAG: DegV family protein [Candidatus Thorarchaeota archaeon]
MTAVKILSDSTCDLPQKIINDYNIGLIPVNVIFNDEIIPQNKLSNKEFFDRLLQGEIATTGVPSPKTYKDAYDKALKSADKIIVITVTGKLSGVYNAARLVAKEFYNDEVIVIDSEAVTLENGMLVYEAAKMAKNNFTAKEITDKITSYIPSTHLLGAVDTLKFLKKGGRINMITWLLGSLLSVKPIIHVEKGQLFSPCRTRSSDHAMEILKRASTFALQNRIIDTVFCGYSYNMERGKELNDFLCDLPEGPTEIIFGEIGPAMSAHIGPNAVGFAWVGDYHKDWL